MSTIYYVCEECGHWSASPEWPDECEHCHQRGDVLIPAATPEAAGRISERVLRGWSASPEAGVRP